MKKITLSTIALIAMSTFAMAGGDIDPVEPTINVPSVETSASASAFYIGAGYSCLQMNFDTPDEELLAMKAVTATLGYDFHEYFAAEVRYTSSIGDLTYKTWDVENDVEKTMSNIGVYLKPKFTVADFATVYALVGYGQHKIEDSSEAGIQFGGGFSLMATDDVEVYVDYRRLYDNEDFAEAHAGQDVAVNSFTVGVNYKF